MNSIKRQSGRPPKAGTAARRAWQEKQRGYRLRTKKGMYGVHVKEVYDHKTGIWSEEKIKAPVITPEVLEEKFEAHNE